MSSNGKILILIFAWKLEKCMGKALNLFQKSTDEILFIPVQKRFIPI